MSKFIHAIQPVVFMALTAVIGYALGYYTYGGN